MRNIMHMWNLAEYYVLMEEVEPVYQEPKGVMMDFLETTYGYVVSKLPGNSNLELFAYVILSALGLIIAVFLLKAIVKSLMKLYVKMQVYDLDGFSEKVRVGSVLENSMQEPAFQAEVWVRRKGPYVKSGQGFLTNFGFFTAYHVVEDVESVMLVKGSNKVEITPDLFVQLEGDVALYKMTQQVACKLGLSQSKLYPIETPHKAGLVVRVHAFGQRTMGVLRPDEGFGLVVYEGSTIKGFSGAPYHVGRMVYGMHMGGSTVNLGLAGAYLHMLAKYELEDTDDYLQQQIMNEGKEFVWQRSPYDPDEARVRIEGKYYQTDMDFIRRMEQKVKGKQVSYKRPDYEEEALSEVSDESLPLAPRGAMSYPDSKNLLEAPAVNAGASGKLEGRVGVPKGILNHLREIDLESREALVSYLMDGQPVTRVQQNEVSGSTRKNSRNRKRKLKKQVQRQVKQSSNNV